MALCGARRIADLDRSLIRTHGAAAQATVG
jgi:isopentenyl diphosphate isomerase/L-lactate dehydrogenase-like FMN-dependent dehydrogenase